MQARTTLRASAGHLVEGIMRSAQLVAAIDGGSGADKLTKAEIKNVIAAAVRHAGYAKKLGATTVAYSELEAQRALLDTEKQERAIAMIDAILEAAAETVAEEEVA